MDPNAAQPPVLDVEVLAPGEEVAVDPAELADLRRAKSLLTSPGAAIRFANVLGSPIERGLKLLPSGATHIIQRASQAALKRALHVALASLKDRPADTPDNRRHRWLVGASGAVGGAFGLAALVVELPISTTLILRSIADIARSQGHDLNTIETRLACLEVFALGGSSQGDNAADSAYWAVRAALARLVTEAVGAISGRGLAAESAPAMVRLLTALAARFGVVVSEQAAAKAVPIVGAAAGAAINVVFMEHFQRMAEGHFIVRRLERRYGTDRVRRLYDSLPTPTPN
ncbi:MAG: EcsC family protein [Verrucomicrobiales bacterium]|nr:EcsC family protein [Verrucomicrobiales bacterium]